METRTKSQEEVLEQVRKLFAKAESTNFGPEAEALMAKGYELMEKFAIDEIMLAKALGANQQKLEVVHKTITVEIKRLHSEAARDLLFTVAKYNRGRALWYRSSEYNPKTGRMRTVWTSRMEVYAFESDLLFIELLYTSLLAQMMRECERQVRIHQPGRGANQFRKSFYEGFVTKIMVRFMERDQLRHQQASDASSSEHAGALVLLDREREVDDIVDKIASRSVAIPRSNYEKNAGAYHSGSKAGGDADISGGSGNLSNKRTALPGG